MNYKWNACYQWRCTSVSWFCIICHVISLFNWANLSSDYKQFVLRDIIQIVKVPTCSFCLKFIAYKTVLIYIMESPTTMKLSGKLSIYRNIWTNKIKFEHGATMWVITQTVTYYTQAIAINIVAKVKLKYHIAGKFGESSVIRQTKTIHGCTYNW